MLESLDEFSRTVASKIESHFPGWLANAAIEEEKGEKVLVVTVRPPSPNITNSLRVDTWNQEVTVAIDYYHAHFDNFTDESGHDALSFITKIMGGAFAVVSYWRDEQCCGSTLLSEDQLPTDNSEYPFANLIKVRSWDGRLDREIKCNPKGSPKPP